MTQGVEDLPFERAYAELESVVQRLEGGELSLEDALSLYERGQMLARHCQALLDRAELRVTVLSGNEQAEANA